MSKIENDEAEENTQIVQALQDRATALRCALEHYSPGPGREKIEAKQAAVTRALARFGI